MGSRGFRLVALAAALAVVPFAVPASNATPTKEIRGTARGDTLRGTARADRILGLAGNDRLFGRGGRDVLLGGAGADTLDGGPGVDQLRCGAGRDVAILTRGDVAVGCEARLGGTGTRPPPPPPQTGPITGQAVPGFSELDREVPRVMRDWGIPGGAVAVVKDGRLVYARGYGYADLEARQPAQPDALFRIGSISKPITAVAILKLVDEGRLTLDARAYPMRSDLLPPPGMATADPRINDVTVRQLLWHAGGWDRERPGGFDPLFMPDEVARVVGVPAPASAEAIMRYMLGVSLDFAPGTRFAYSNVGYTILGRVVEKASGLPYEQYVKGAVLGPAGASRTQVGRSLEAGRLPGEVHYYDLETAPSVFPGGGTVPAPYGGYYVEAADSAGAWVASTIDLLRFLTAVDGLPSRPDILSAASIQAMTARPPGLWENTATYYGMGWDISPFFDRWSHNGSVPGTWALLVRSQGGVAWAGLFNARQMRPNSFFPGQVDQAIDVAIDGVRAWPAHDLFSQFP